MKQTKMVLLRILQGMLVGVGAILPGISGGVLLVSFGLYQPLMALFAHPLQNFNKVVTRLWPAGVGWAVGFFGVAKVLNAFFSADSVLAICLFIGLILGTYPGLWKQAGKKGRSRDHYLAMFLSFVIMWSFFWMLSHAGAMQITPSPMWFLFAGALWGLSMAVPGLSSSSVLIFMGLFEPMTAGLAALKLGVVIPMLFGAAATVAITARVVNRMFHRYYTMSFHAILGVVAASTVVILPTSISSVGQLLSCGLMIFVGFGASFLLDKFSPDQAN